MSVVARDRERREAPRTAGHDSLGAARFRSRSVRGWGHGVPRHRASGRLVGPL